ncbi:MAG: GerMN domain-containing protein [Peptococcaceae bacterium]|nr:GerMN domain-containing protein [Peptococcaceae bacterium]
MKMKIRVRRKKIKPSKKILRISRIGLGVCFLFCCFLFNGCAPIEKIQQWKAEQTQAVKGAASEEPTAAGNQLYLPPAQTQEGNSLSTTTAPAETVEVTLYFVNEKGDALVAEKRTIPKEEGIARAAVNALLQGPQNKGLQAAVPTGTLLKDINIKEDGSCIVDFNNTLLTKMEAENGEMLTVAAIVQTLAQFSSVKEVQILVDGKIIETLGGKVDISKPIQTEN